MLWDGVLSDTSNACSAIHITYISNDFVLSVGFSFWSLVQFCDFDRMRLLLGFQSHLFLVSIGL